MILGVTRRAAFSSIFVLLSNQSPLLNTAAVAAASSNIPNCSSSSSGVSSSCTTSTSAFLNYHSSSSALHSRGLKDSDSQSGSSSSSNTAMRAWTCHGKDQFDLVERLVSAGIVRSEKVRNVLRAVDRQPYVPQNHPHPYADAPQSIGLGQTISAPHMHAHVLEEILPYIEKKKNTNEQVKILDVGCGSGYLTAVFGRWVAPQQTAEKEDDSNNHTILGKLGTVYGIDVLPKLVQFTKMNMEKCDGDLIKNGIVNLQVGDGWKGLPEQSPFDVIHVGAAASDFPIPLLQQLKVGGVLIIPVGPQGGIQNLYRVERISDAGAKVSEHNFDRNDYRMVELLGVRYVPLVNPSAEKN